MESGGNKASVVICTHGENRMSDLRECVESLLEQSCREFEILVVVDHNPKLYKGLSARYRDTRVKVALSDSRTVGATSAMNYGVKKSRGEIVCFIDDDAVADQNWLSELMNAYDDYTIGAGGRIEPLWVSKRPRYLPEEFYWMIGATVNFLRRRATETRNLWFSNISYTKRLFIEAGLLLESLGKFGNRLFQGAEPEFAARLWKMTGRVLKYIPTATVYHKIYGNRTTLVSLLRRAYEQGYVKAYVEKLHEDRYALSVERSYLKSVLVWNFKRLENVIAGREREGARWNSSHSRCWLLGQSS